MKTLDADQIFMAEKDFENTVKEMALMFNWAYSHAWRSFHSPEGWPDCVFARLEPEPRLIIAELKTDNLKISQPSFEQYAWLYLLQHIGQPWGPLGFDTYLWRPADIEKIAEILR